MKKVILTLLLVLSLSVCHAQGKIFPAADAEKFFGKVTAEVQISLTDLKNYVSKTEKSIMFQIIDKQLFVLDDVRKPITSNSKYLNEAVVVHKFSKSVVLEFIDKSSFRGKSLISIQIRGVDTLVITNGEEALEWSQGCPPFCGAV